MKLLINTQYMENYGAHDWDGTGECPQYWKFKGGQDFFVKGIKNDEEATMAVMALRDQIMPPTINCPDIDPECAADVIPVARPAPLDAALSAAFGFGGHNMILLWRKI